MRVFPTVVVAILTFGGAAMAAGPLAITPLDANGVPVAKPGATTAAKPPPVNQPANQGVDLLGGPIDLANPGQAVVIGGAPAEAGRLPPGAEVVSLSPEICRSAVAHVPDASVAASALNASGQPVAPADLPQPLGGSSTIPPIEGARIYGKPLIVAPGSAYTGAVRVGTASVDPYGRVLLNGRPLDDDSAVKLARLCDAQGFR